METLRVSGLCNLNGEMTVPGDKSISHRALMLLSIAEGTATVTNFLDSEDCLSTLAAMRALGAAIDRPTLNTLRIHGAGIDGLSEPDDVIDCGNSGTMMRLILGLLAGLPFTAFLTGDSSLRSRPMGRVVSPLRSMGATVIARSGDALAPICVRGGNLRPIEYTPPVASAQVKSCVLLAGLFADGETTVHEPVPTRDHTERMLSYLGADINVSGDTVHIRGKAKLHAKDILVPGDISSAAFFLAPAAAIPGCRLTVRNLGVNPTRIALLTVLERMGASIEFANRRQVSGEDVADISVEGGRLRGVDVGPSGIAEIIDEIPILALIATQAAGTTRILGAGELRAKESDRLSSITELLTRLGAEVTQRGDDLYIDGPTRLRPAKIHSRGDHRIAMTGAMAACFTDGEIVIRDTSCINTSFPGFTDRLVSFGACLRVDE